MHFSALLRLGRVNKIIDLVMAELQSPYRLPASRLIIGPIHQSGVLLGEFLAIDRSCRLLNPPNSETRRLIMLPLEGVLQVAGVAGLMLLGCRQLPGDLDDFVLHALEEGGMASARREVVVHYLFIKLS